jgi:type II secretory pathway pseudopilin PulG
MRFERTDRRQRKQGEDGFALVALVVAIFVILLVIAVAAPRVAQELRRDREVEAVHRGDQYVRAVQLYYRKFGHYPGSMEQLEKSNNIRFLRQKYVDPMTGKPDWRLIKVGEAKTTVKGFFGQPLAGIASAGLGSAAGMASPGGNGATVGGSSTGSAFGSSSPGSSFGASSGSSFGSSSGSSFGSSAGSSFGSSGSSPLTGPGSSGSGTGNGLSGGATDSSPGSSTGSGQSGGISSQSATSFSGSGGAFMGVGSSAGGNSIMELNEQKTYATWEFLYDPRIEQMKAKVSLFGGGPSSTDATSLGSASGMNSGIGGTPVGGSSPATGTGTGTGGGAGGTGTGGTGTGGTTPPWTVVGGETYSEASR